VVLWWVFLFIAFAINQIYKEIKKYNKKTNTAIIIAKEITTENISS
jgi:hypothetical protein